MQPGGVVAQRRTGRRTTGAGHLTRFPRLLDTFGKKRAQQQIRTFPVRDLHGKKWASPGGRMQLSGCSYRGAGALY
ncbi:hypothetical protein L3i22_084430 [Actinoplanes sp. L3-i22]|nr:hypothetical protein L3i22_084430 [Actinoplanes sp. L3-i22]